MNALSALLYAVLIGAAPVVFFLWFFYKRDKWDPEPLRLVLTVFVLGSVAAYILSLVIDLQFRSLSALR
jgi:RsiW-degrading membrane proteinase PrsW (M82 family)